MKWYMRLKRESKTQKKKKHLGDSGGTEGVVWGNIQRVI